MSRNFQLAMHLGPSNVVLPTLPPTASGQVMVVDGLPASPTDAVITKWQTGGVGGAGVGLPISSSEGDIMVSGPGPNFNWTAGDIDCGIY